MKLEKIRQERATRLLRTTPLGVESIAARVGYSDVRALRRAVRRWYGTTPTEVRRAATPVAAWPASKQTAA
jgi:transcriptional regulator GlxA family with amidase domain